MGTNKMAERFEKIKKLYACVLIHYDKDNTIAFNHNEGDYLWIDHIFNQIKKMAEKNDIELPLEFKRVDLVTLEEFKEFTSILSYDEKCNLPSLKEIENNLEKYLITDTEKVYLCDIDLDEHSEAITDLYEVKESEWCLGECDEMFCDSIVTSIEENLRYSNNGYRNGYDTDDIYEAVRQTKAYRYLQELADKPFAMITSRERENANDFLCAYLEAGHLLTPTEIKKRLKELDKEEIIIEYTVDEIENWDFSWNKFEPMSYKECEDRYALFELVDIDDLMDKYIEASKQCIKEELPKEWEIQEERIKAEKEDLETTEIGLE